MTSATRQSAELSALETKTTDWVLPVGLGTAAPDTRRTWTRLGVVDATHEVVVDAAGAISTAPGVPLVEWWIAGDKRWYFPARESTVTQSTVDGAPVVETRMRVPGGEVINRNYAIRRSSAEGGGEAVVIEIENASALPFGVALAIRPFALDAWTRVERIELQDTALCADGRTLVTLSKPPRRAIARPLAAGDIAAAIEGGEATGATFEPLSCPEGGAQGAVIVPVAHRTTFRAVVPVGETTDDRAAATYPSAMPSSSQVVDGWHVQARNLARVSVPDARLNALLEIVAPTLVGAPLETLAAGGVSLRSPGESPRWDHVAAIAGALGEVGLRETAEVFLARAAVAADVEAPGSAPQPGLDWLVMAFGEHLVRFPDQQLAVALVDTALYVASRHPARRLRRGRPGPPEEHPVPGGQAAVLQAAAVVLEVAGQARAAGDARRMADAADDGADATPSGIATDVVQRALWARHGARLGRGTQAWRTLDTLLDIGSSTQAWPASLSTDLNESHRTDRHSVAATAAMASLAFALLVHVDERRLRILSALPAAWLGQKLDVNGLATPAGIASFALRWHGNRPALLWELDSSGSVPVDDVDATALDPHWHSHDLQGDALLSPVERLEPTKPAGVTITGLQIGRAPKQERE